jgi:hypothetical protein
MAQGPPSPDHLRIELAHKLGFPRYPSDTTVEPYLNHLMNRCIGETTIEGRTKLFLRVITYFDVGVSGRTPLSTKRSIQGLIDALSTDTQYSELHEWEVEDIVLYNIGLWMMLLSSFVLYPVAGSAIRRVTLAYTLQMGETLPGRRPYEEDVAGLVVGSGLLPTSAQYPRFNEMVLVPDETFVDSDSLESLSIDATRLNIYTLKVFGAVDVVWTYNVSRHLMLSKRAGQHTLEVFSLPCALSASPLRFATTGIGADLESYSLEIRESYSVLFNAWPDVPRHAKFGAGWFCFCPSCSARRHRDRAITEYKTFHHRAPGGKRYQREHTSEYDPMLMELISKEPSDWTPDLFPKLWSRILILEQHLQVAKPWSVWVLFRDRRDTLQFWTFL